jgi:hypothetical protein
MMMQRPPLTEIAHAAVTRTAARAQKAGLDQWEELNRLGLLATEARIREIEVSTLKNSLERLQRYSVDELLFAFGWHRQSSNPAAPDDLLRAVYKHLEEIIRIHDTPR